MVEDAHADVVVVSGGDSGMNEFFVQPGIALFADLRGRVILVDAPDTAYALQVKKLMSQHGVAPSDYTIKPAGAGVFRFKAMAADKSNAAAILNPPFTVQAQALGMKSLGNTVALLGPYQAVGVFVLRSWADQNRETVAAFLAAEIEAVRYVRDPSHRAECIDLLINEDKLPRDIAERTYGELVDPDYGFTADARFDMQGFRNMLALRAEVEGKPVAPPERYLDLGYYERAMKQPGNQPPLRRTRLRPRARIDYIPDRMRLSADNMRGRLMQGIPAVTSFIGEEIAAGDIGFDLVRPQDGQVVGRIDEAGKSGVDAAVKAAKQAFDENRKSPTHKRAAWLKTAAAVLTKNADELANLICEDVGKPIWRVEIRRPPRARLSRGDDRGAHADDDRGAAGRHHGGGRRPFRLYAPPSLRRRCPPASFRSTPRSTC